MAAWTMPLQHADGTVGTERWPVAPAQPTRRRTAQSWPDAFHGPGKPAVRGLLQTGPMDRVRTGSRTTAQQAGDAAETLVADHLCALGWTVLARNVRLGRKEVDIVAFDPGPPGAVVIVEVRWRVRRDFGLPEDTFDWRKRAHLRAAVGRMLETGVLPDGRALPAAALRVDLVVVEPPTASGAGPRVRHHRDALAG